MMSPPRVAWIVPSLTQLVPVMFSGGRLPELSPLIVPRLSRLAVPTLMRPSLPPWTVTPAAIVRILPTPESVSPLKPLMLTVPVPASVCVPAKARLSALPLKTTLPPASVRPAPPMLTTEMVPPPEAVRARLPASVTSFRVLVVWAASRLSVTVPPTIVPPSRVQMPVLASSVAPVRFSVPIRFTVPVLVGVRLNVPSDARLRLPPR